MPIVTRDVSLPNPRDTWTGDDSLVRVYYYVTCQVQLSRVRLGFLVTTGNHSGFLWLHTRFMGNGETFFVACPDFVSSTRGRSGLSFFAAVMFYPYTRKPVLPFTGQIAYYVTD